MLVVTVLDLVLALEVTLETSSSHRIHSWLASLRSLVMSQIVVLIVSLISCLVGSIGSCLTASILRSLASKPRDSFVEVASSEKVLSWLGEANTIGRFSLIT